MKFLTIFFLNFLLLSNYVIAETTPRKSQIIKQSRACIKDSQKPVCGELISQIEKLQMVLFEQKRFKCQSSLLGLQSELIEAYYLKKFSHEGISFMIPYVIKNC